MALLCSGIATAAALAAAWVSDDGMVTFRTVENLAGGDGFRWNVAERTQTATHPLWILLLAGCRWLTGELYLTAITVSLLCTAGATLLVARLARSNATALVTVPLAMLASRTGTAYATGGLENPLTYLLVAAFAGAWFAEGPRPARVRRLGLLAALLVLARIDLVLLVLPCVVASLRGVPWRAAGRALLPGGVLLVLWGAFALLYFGTAIPTPGYAKAMALDVPAGELARQGLRYLADLGWRDPATALLLGAAVMLGLGAARGRAAGAVAPALGIALQVVYTLKIGGDFMAGRFFSAALFLAMATLAAVLRPRGAALLAVGLGAAAAVAPGWPAWLRPVPPAAEARMEHGIADERSYYAEHLALWSPRRDWPEYGAFVRPLQAAGRTRPMVALAHAVGHFGLQAGPLVHLVEPWICDPLLVRLPLADPAHWRIGHFTRRVPEGYLETLASGENRIHHPALREYHDLLAAVLRAPLLDGARLRALGRLWLGDGAELLARYVREEYRRPPLVTVPAARLAADVAPGTFWFDRDCVVVREGGLRVAFDAPADGAALLLVADGSGQGELRFCRGEQVLGTAPVALGAFGAAVQRIAVPDGARGFDAVEVHLSLPGDPAVTVLPVFAVLGLRPE